jgi:hypothetical protein
MVASLFIVAFLFNTQTRLASLLAGGRESFSDDEAGNAFFDLVKAASSTGWMNAFLAEEPAVPGEGVSPATVTAPSSGHPRSPQ